MRKYHSALGGGALALALALTGCGGGDTKPEVQETPSQTASDTPSPTTTPTPKTPEERAAEQLTEYLEVRDDFYREATIDFKRLNRVATGDEFLQIQAAVADIDQYDIKVTGEYVHTLAEPRNRGAEIRIVDCEDRTGVTERNKDGKDIKRNDPNGNPLRNPVPVEYTLVRDKSAWKVSDSDIKWDQPC